MPQGIGTYGSQVGRPKKYDAGGDVDTTMMNYFPQRKPMSVPSLTGVPAIDAYNQNLAGVTAAPVRVTPFSPSPRTSVPAPVPTVPTAPVPTAPVPTVPTAAPTVPTVPTAPVPTAVAPPTTQLAPYTGAGNVADPNYISGINRVETGLDATTKQMLFGLDGKGGFIPGAMQAAESTFFNPDGTPRVVDQTVAGFTPDQLQAMQMAREQAGIQDRYLTGAEEAFRSGLGALEGGRSGFFNRLGESEDLLRQTTGAYDPSMTQKYFDPFEDKVVQQSIEDIRKYGAQQDISDTARAIGSGGLSAFGERAGKFAGERAAGRERGLMEAIAGIRSGGLDRARQFGMSEFERQQQARRQAASGLGGFAANRFGADQTLGGAYTGFGSGLAGLGGMQQQAGAFDINQLLGSGGMQQALAQQQAEAQRANLLQAQQAPLAQYQALAPFISMAPAGQFQTSTQFAPQPSALQTGLGVGLSALGGIGSFLNPRTT
jgi:hypothetical protein